MKKINLFDLAFEEAVIGAILLDKAVISILGDFLFKECFYSIGHQYIYEACLQLFSSSYPIDLITVNEQLKVNKTLDLSGGSYYLVELTNRVASTANVEYHARMIHKYYKARKIEKLAKSMLDDIYNSKGPNEVSMAATAELANISAANDESQTTLKKQMSESLDDAKNRFDKGDETIGETLFNIGPLDRKISGVEPGDVIALVGRPAMGKSSLVTAIMRNALESGKKMYFWSGEAPKSKTFFRAAADLTNIGTRKLEGGEFYAEDNKWMLKEIEGMMNEVEEHGDNILLDSGLMDTDRMRSLIISEFNRNGTKLFVFDRLELFGDVANARDEIAAVSKVTSIMRQMATTLQIAIVVLIQLKLETEKNHRKVPQMKDILGGTKVHANLTKGIACYRPEEYGYDDFEDGESSKSKGDIIIVKNNYDARGKVRLSFKGELQTWRALESNDLLPSLPSPDTAVTIKRTPDLNNKQNNEDIPF